MGFSKTSGGTGVQLESPLVGLRVGLTEGIEVHLFGLALGVDLWPPAIIVPLGPGRIGLRRSLTGSFEGVTDDEAIEANAIPLADPRSEEVAAAGREAVLVARVTDAERDPGRPQSTAGLGREPTLAVEHQAHVGRAIDLEPSRDRERQGKGAEHARPHAAGLEQHVAPRTREKRHRRRGDRRRT